MTKRVDRAATIEQMERELELYKIDSWKWYCHTDPGRSGNGFQLDDEKLTYPFYEKSRELGIKKISVHKGFSYQSKTLERSAPKYRKSAAGELLRKTRKPSTSSAAEARYSAEIQPIPE